MLDLPLWTVDTPDTAIPRAQIAVKQGSRLDETSN